MKANELRLGNWIEFNNFISPPNNLQVTPRMFRQLGMDLSENLDLELSGYHKGIPLTEEWLLKMGGKKVNNLDWCIMFGGIEFYCRYNKFWYCSIGSVYLSDRIQFVHQVQNLYFSITNQELTIM
jgi:hypothetical protein